MIQTNSNEYVQQNTGAEESQPGETGTEAAKETQKAAVAVSAKLDSEALNKIDDGRSGRKDGKVAGDFTDDQLMKIAGEQGKKDEAMVKNMMGSGKAVGGMFGGGGGGGGGGGSMMGGMGQ